MLFILENLGIGIQEYCLIIQEDFLPLLEMQKFTKYFCIIFFTFSMSSLPIDVFYKNPKHRCPILYSVVLYNNNRLWYIIINFILYNSLLLQILHRLRKSKINKNKKYTEL